MRNNKRGFTITELIIVIAIIAILAAILIPTFAGLVDEANKSANLADARAIYNEYLVQNDAEVEGTVYIKVKDGVYFKVENGKLSEEAEASAPANVTIIIKSGETIQTEAASVSG